MSLDTTDLNRSQSRVPCSDRSTPLASRVVTAPGHAIATTQAGLLRLDSGRVARCVLVGCVSIEMGLLVADYFINVGRATEIGALRRLANIAREDGLASWLAATQALLIGLTAWGLWLCARAHHVSGWRRHGWLLVAVLFTYMAIDDGAQLHERIGTAAAASSGLSAFPSFTWQPLFAPALGVLLLASAVFLWTQEPSVLTRLAIVVAIGLFGVAFLLDFFEGLPIAHPANIYTELVLRFDLADFTQAQFAQRPYDTLLHFSRALEETAEMLAGTLLWAVMLSHAGAVVATLQIRSS